MELLVSAIITTYDRNPQIVCNAIDSICSQTYTNIEIIVVDDNKSYSQTSEDLKIALRERYPEIKYLKQNGNKGACAARNLGIVNAKGDFLAFLDDDDIWMKDKIEKQLDKMIELEMKPGMIYCTGITKFKDANKEEKYCNFKNFKEIVSLKDMLEFDYVGSTSQPLIQKKCFVKLGGFDENQPARQDYEMWIRIATEYSIIGIKEMLFVHNMHLGEQISKDKRKAYVGYKNIYKKYKEYYKQNNKAKILMLSYIISSRSNINMEILCFAFKRKLAKIGLKERK